MNYEKKYVDLGNGERYAYIEKGKGEGVILIHGNMVSSVSMLPIIDDLSKDYACFAPDLRGFGDSSYNKPFRHLKELAEDLKLFMDKMNIKRAHLVGWSTGTPIALEFAAKYPEKVITLFGIEGVSHKGYYLFKKDENGKVLVNVPYNSYEEMSKDTKSYPSHSIFINKRKDIIEKIWNSLLLVNKRPSDEDFKILIDENAKERCQNDINWCWSVENMSDVDTIYAKGDNTIKKVVCPCAFTTGDLDMVVTRKMILENYHAITGSKLIEYKNCGHVVLVDCLEELNKDIREHIKEK